MKNSFAPTLRIRHKRDFTKVFSSLSNGVTKKIKADYCALFVRPSQLNHPRLGVIVRKKTVAKASSRNRLRRIVRESFREKQHLIGNFDIICIIYQYADQQDNATWRAIIDQNFTKL